MTQRPSVSGHLRTDAATAGRRQADGSKKGCSTTPSLSHSFPLVPTRRGHGWEWEWQSGHALVLVWALALALHTACSSQQGLARGRYASEAGQLEKARLRSEQQIDPHSAVCTQYTALDTRTHLRTAFTRWPSSTSSPATYT